MILRVWSSRLVPGREADFEAYAIEHSLPMLRRHHGCLGVVLAGSGSERRVLSLWADAASADALEASDDYRAVSAALSERGILAAVGEVTREPAGASSFLTPADVPGDDAITLASAAARRFLASLADRPVAWTGANDAVTVPDGIGLAAAFAHFGREIEPRLSASNGPRYFGFVTGGASSPGLAGDWLAAATNQNVSNDIGSIAATVERATCRRLAELFGLASDLRGHFTSGATAANLVCLATARQALHRRLGFDSAEQGLAAAPRLRVLAGAAHSSVAKALAVLGIGRAALEAVPCLPGRTAVDPRALAERLADDDRATIVVASAGEVNTGDFDDLVAIGAACRRHAAWLHVDGAFGLFAALSPAHAAMLAGIDQADSVTVDMHKWLNVPYDSAVAFVRDPRAQREVFRASAAYLGDSEDPLHYTPENSRRFRALATWMVLAAEGARGIGDAVVRCCGLAVALGQGIAATPGLELLDAVRLNIVCFALAGTPSVEARDAFLARLNGDGRVFMTPTVLRGRPAVRAAISNWSSREGDIAAALDAVRAALD